MEKSVEMNEVRGDSATTSTYEAKRQPNMDRAATHTHTHALTHSHICPKKETNTRKNAANRNEQAPLKMNSERVISERIYSITASHTEYNI